MMSGPFPKTAFVLVVAGLLCGCSHTDNIIPRRTTVGTLKTSVSHLEYENDQLRRQVTKLESNNREIENHLVEEESSNGDLTARLNDARHELRKRGIDDESIQASRPDEDTDKPVTRPAGRSTKSRRKPPFAKIPSRGDDFDDSDPADDGSLGAPKKRDDDDLQSRNEGFERWLPIARGTSAPSTKQVR